MNPLQLKIVTDIFFKTGTEDLSVLVDDVRKIHTVLQDIPLLTTLNNHLSVTKKQKILLWHNVLNTLEVHHFTQSYFLALGKLGLLKFVPIILQKILKTLDTNTIDVFLTSATPLTPELYQRLTQNILHLNPFFVDKSFTWNTVLDPSLLGGYTLAIGPYWLDMSVRTQLKKLEQRVKQL